MRVKYMTREMARLMRKYPYAQLQDLYNTVEEKVNEKNKKYKDQLISPYYVSLNGG